MGKFLNWIGGFIFVIFLLNSCLGLGGSSNYEVVISGLNHGFVSTNLDPRVSEPEFKNSIGYLDEYFYVINFDVNASEDNDAKGEFPANIIITDYSIFEANIFNASSGKINEITFTDQSGSQGKISTITLAIPDNPDDTYQYNISLRVVPKATGYARVSMFFGSEDDTNYTLVGESSMGFSRDIAINNSQIETPVLSLNSLNQLSWKHVRGASYYKVFVNGQVLNNPGTTNEFRYNISAPLLGVGTTLIFPGSLSSYGLFGLNIIQIKAYGNIVYVLESNFSNSVEVII